jgi:transketolase C-terminal domain/subunit
MERIQVVILFQQCPIRVKRLGIPDKFGEVAMEDYFFEKHGFGVKHIAAAAARILETQ